MRVGFWGYHREDDMRHSDKIPTPQESMKMGLAVGVEDGTRTLKGSYIIHLVDSDTGEVLHHSEHSTVGEPCGVQ